MANEIQNIQTQQPQGEIILYQPDETVRLEVRLENETVWLNRQQLADLFGRDVKTIGKHVNNALREELRSFAVVAKFATTAKDGKTYQVEYYNLDMVLSVGYRVKSAKGIEFRAWANHVLKDYLLRGYAINQQLMQMERRMDARLDAHIQNEQEHLLQIESTLSEHQQKIDFFVRTNQPPVEGVFFEGQIFDAYHFVSDLIRKARHSVVLIDNYVDDTVLTMLDKRSDGVAAMIYTQHIGQQLQLDIARHNAQYAAITIEQFGLSHDRFLLIDDEVYHIGASLKDLGKKWFAFTLMRDLTAQDLIQKIDETR